MTYEEYKKSNKNKEHKILKSILNKLFTVIIFSTLIIILSNFNENFRNFLINKVLNSTMDFSKVNNVLDKVTNIYNQEEKIEKVFEEKKEIEEYKDGYKYKVNENSEVILEESGIVTFIGEKEDYENTIIVQQSNGYYAWYGNVKEEIKLYDYIEKGDVIGKSMSNYYYHILYKDDKPIKYEN